MPNYPGRRKGTRRITVFAGGRQVERIFEGTKAEAEVFEARLRLELEERAASSSKTSKPTEPDFERFCVDVYTPHAKQHLKASTWSKVRRYQVETLTLHLGRYLLTEIGVAVVEAYKTARLATVYKGRPVKPATVNNELRVLRTILGYAKSLGKDLGNLAVKRLPERGAGRVRHWTPTQVRALFAAAKVREPVMVPLLVFIANTGCRKGEAIAAEWTWVDEAAGMLRIPSNEAWQPKNGLPREVPLSDTLAATLASLARRGARIFPNRRGDPYACFPEELFREIRQAAKLVGGPHTLRHSFASIFLASQPDMFLLAQVMGHSHERVTELYSHLLPEHLSRARNAVDLAPDPEAGEEVSQVIH